MPYATVDDLAEYQGLTDFGLRERRAEVALNTAGRVVSGIAPVPTDPLLLPDYKARATDAELQIADWLVTTRGFLSSVSAPAGLGSKSYSSDPVVLKMVKDTMGPFADSGSRLRPATIVSPSALRG